LSWRNQLTLSIPRDSRGAVLNLLAGSAVQWPEFATGYEHVWRLVGKNCILLLVGLVTVAPASTDGPGRNFKHLTEETSPDRADHNAMAVKLPNRRTQLSGRNQTVYGLRLSVRNSRKTLASTGKISMLQPETAPIGPTDAHVRIGRGPRNSGKQL
jgi:hypothetical protein